MAEEAVHPEVAAPASEVLQPLLEQAVRESLRAIARSAAEPDLGGSSKSIECIVRGVASRVLEEAGEALARLHAPAEAGTLRVQSKEPVEPLLQDLTATPWVIWREGAVHHHHQADYSDALAATAVEADLAAADEESVPEDASRRSREPPGAVEQPPESGVAPASRGGDGFGAEEEPGTPPPLVARVSTSGAYLSPERPPQLPRARRSTPVAWDGGGGLPVLFGDAAGGGRLCVAPQMRGVGDFGIAGGRPIVVREGLRIESSGARHLVMQWKGRPRAVLVVAKPGDPLVVATLQDMVAWLSSQGMVVVLEPQLLADQPDLRTNLQRARTFSRADRLERSIDLVITLGGDGTLTWAVSLFRDAMPPVLSFAAGSLGFLTPFPLDGWVRTLTWLLDLHRPHGPLPLTCRMRLRVVVRRRRRAGSDASAEPPLEDENLQVQCLNEVLVHRGQSGALAKLDVGVDGERVTLVQGDGIILATPTGSTAYSLAAGGSMVHPGVPAILLTPVSPHSLSFRPAVLPDSAVVTIGLPLTARCGAALSVDGKDVCNLRLGDSVEVAASPHPVPTICRNNATHDWFASVHEALQWNGRVEQK